MRLLHHDVWLVVHTGHDLARPGAVGSLGCGGTLEAEVKAEVEKRRIKFCDEVLVFDGAGREGMAQ